MAAQIWYLFEAGRTRRRPRGGDTLRIDEALGAYNMIKRVTNDDVGEIRLVADASGVALVNSSLNSNFLLEI